MKTTLFAIVALVAGSVVGALVARQEFRRDILPIDTRQIGTGMALRPGENMGQGPRLTVINGERHDFGSMDRNAKMTHVFKIRNDGDSLLTLTQKGTSCKCTMAEFQKDQLEPGEQSEIKLEWDAKNAVEPFEQYAEFETNDRIRPNLRLTVFGRIVSTLTARPSLVLFNDVSANEPAEVTIHIYGVRGNELTIVKHEFTTPALAEFFDLKFRPLSADELAQEQGATAGVAMTARLRPGLPLGSIRQSVKLTTNLNPDESFEIPINGSIVSDISLAGPRVSPANMRVDLGTFSTTQGTKSTIYLLVKGPHRDDLQLSVAEVEPAAELDVQVGEAIRENPKIVRYPLTLEVPPGVRPISRGTAGSEIVVRVETTHPDIKELTFRVRYVILD